MRHRPFIEGVLDNHGSPSFCAEIGLTMGLLAASRRISGIQIRQHTRRRG
jgi:hypothetical protein